jgi:hypothetical protein
MHRLHRTLGSVLGVLLFAWFASVPDKTGATFAGRH